MDKCDYKIQGSTYELSEWKCYLFGSHGGNGLVWTPEKGKHPNFFWRFMQRIMFGNKWVRDPSNRK